MNDWSWAFFAAVLGVATGWGVATLQQILVLNRLMRRMRQAIDALESDRRDPRA